MEFKIFHDYQKMVRRHAAEPLLCEHCRSELILRMEAFTDEPILKCYGCGSLFKPGKRMYDEITEAVNTYFNKEKQ